MLCEQACCYNADDTEDVYDDDNSSEVSLEMGAEAGPAFEARAQAQSLAGVGPSVGPGIVAEPAAHHSGLRRFSKDHAVTDDIQKRFLIAVENDEHAAKKRVQDMLVRVTAQSHPERAHQQHKYITGRVDVKSICDRQLQACNLLLTVAINKRKAHCESTGWPIAHWNDWPGSLQSCPLGASYKSPCIVQHVALLGQQPQLLKKSVSAPLLLSMIVACAEIAVCRVQEWKKKHHLDTCLQTPKPNSDIMKKAILHGVVCFSKTDHPVRIMRVSDLLAVLFCTCSALQQA